MFSRSGIQVAINFFQAPGSITWPICEITHCIEIPEKDDFIANITVEEDGFIPIDGEIFYSCAVEGTVYTYMRTVSSYVVRCGHVFRDFESEAKTRCNFQFR